MARARTIKGLETKLGYQFKAKELLERALTHASTRAVTTAKVRGAKSQAPTGLNQDNERLEFLGDRVLGLAIAELLVELDPEAREGALAKRFNRVVRRDACACIGRDLGLGAALRLSSSEDESGGRNKDTILADAVEALLAAIFIEAGYDVVRGVVRRLWTDLLLGLPDQVADAKSVLQEWAQGQFLTLPEYVEISREGPDHAPQFTTEVRIKGLPPARGMGTNKRASEQSAAMAVLAREGVWRDLTRA